LTTIDAIRKNISDQGPPDFMQLTPTLLFLAADGEQQRSKRVKVRALLDSRAQLQLLGPIYNFT
jgi:hypothetical protein